MILTNEIEIDIPNDVSLIFDKLKSNGHDSYIVGGCVRDCIMGIKPHDYDICTSALPNVICDIFSDYQVIKTGLQHGTVTVVINDNQYEITTYRIDGEYTDNRHPKNVEFVDDLSKDLSRRDFTINAMAYNTDNGLVDLFDGVSDIENNVIRCVGDATNRFNEDALRMLRAIRFALRFKFDIDKNTYDAMLSCKENIKNISVERIAKELFGAFDKTEILADSKILIAYLCDILNIRLNTNIEFTDKMLYRLQFVNSICSRLAVLFYDLNTDEILKKLHVSNDIIHQVLEIQSIGYEIFNTQYWKYPVNVDKMHLGISSSLCYGYPYMSRIILSKLKHASIEDVITFASVLEKNSVTTFCMYELLGFQTIVVRDRKDSVHIKDLNVNGNDLLNLGIETEQIGKILSRVLNEVMWDKLKNDKESILKYVKNRYWRLIK